MTIVYCLTTQGSDEHAASTLVSVLSVRRLHPGAEIVILTDTDSAKGLNDCGHALLKAVDRLVAKPAPPGTPSMRNRFIKTQQRKWISGDFLYLDGDTVVVAPLDPIFETKAPFAAVSNHNSLKGKVERNFVHELDVFRENRWEIRDLPYVNGGVLFFRDTPETHHFGETWHRKWLEASRRGKHYDQPSLNSALWESGIDYQLMESRFNAQIHVRPRTAIGASIWHIYSSLPGELAPKTGLNALVQGGLVRGQITASEVDSLCGHPSPWEISNPLDAWVVRSMVRHRDFLPVDAFERKWLTGHRRRACQDWIKSCFHRIRTHMVTMLKEPVRAVRFRSRAKRVVLGH